MTTMYQRQRMRDRHEARAWHDTIADHEDAKDAFRDEARRLLAAGAAVDGVDARLLTADELHTYSKQPARQMQPAEAATEIGADDNAARGFVIALPAALLAWALIAAGAVTFKFWPQIAAFVGIAP